MAVNLGPSEGNPYVVRELCGGAKGAKKPSGSAKKPSGGAIGRNWTKVSGGGGCKSASKQPKNITYSGPRYDNTISNEASIPDRQPIQRHAPTPPPRGGPQPSSLTRSRYVNVEIGKLYRARSQSCSAEHLERSGTSAMRSKSMPHNHNQRHGSYGQASDLKRVEATGHPPTTTLFSASLGFFGPDSGILRHSRDRLNSFPGEGEEEIL